MHEHRTPTSRLSRIWELTIALCSLATVALLALPAVSEADNCPNAVFRNGPSSRLPDCRAYEMATPVYKEGFPVYPNKAGRRGDELGEDGSHLFGESWGVFAGAEQDEFKDELGNDYLSIATYIFTRGESGWTTTAINPPGSQYYQAVLFGLRSDLTSSLWVAVSNVRHEAQEIEGASPSEVASFYIRTSDGPLAEVGRILPSSVKPNEVNGYLGAFYDYVGASQGNLSDVLYEMSEAHWPGDETNLGAPSLYEYVGTGNSAPLLVGVSGGAGSASVISRCGTRLALGATESGGPSTAISESGATIYFTALPCVPSPAVQELSARVENGQPGAHTVAISEPSPSDCSECNTAEGVRQPATAVGFSKDGSKAFFTTTQPLLGGDESNNLYEYDFQGEAGRRVIRVSGGDATVSNPTAGVESVLSVSPDGSCVYFTASGVLTKIPNSLGQKAEAGRSNLYLYERDAQHPDGHTVFVLPYADVNGEFRPSQSGGFLGFDSLAHLTSGDLSSVAQAFVYDSQTGGFVRVSIGQDGFNDDGNTGSVGKLLVANDGAAFFETKNPLVPQAVNGGYDVYEYREGSVSLISSGEDTRAEEAGELDFISPSGQDVFFQAFDQLVPRDTDEQVDTYDARVDGGFPEAPAPSPCQGDACQGPLTGAPVLLSPGSEFQAGGETAVSSTTDLPETPTSVVKSKPKSRNGSRRHKKERKRKRRAKKASVGVRVNGIGGRR